MSMLQSLISAFRDLDLDGVRVAKLPGDDV